MLSPPEPRLVETEASDDAVELLLRVIARLTTRKGPSYRALAAEIREVAHGPPDGLVGEPIRLGRGIWATPASHRVAGLLRKARNLGVIQ